jgi:hypothetical protein
MIITSSLSNNYPLFPYILISARPIAIALSYQSIGGNSTQETTSKLHYLRLDASTAPGGSRSRARSLRSLIGMFLLVLIPRALGVGGGTEELSDADWLFLLMSL